MFYHNNQLWNYGVIYSNKGMNLDVVKYLVLNAVKLHLKGESTCTFENKKLDLEGKITATGKTAILGSLSGKTYIGELETTTGKINVTFLLSNPVRPELN